MKASRELEALARAASAALAGAREVLPRELVPAAQRHGIAALLGVADPAEQPRILQSMTRLRAVLAALREAAIPAMPVKGPVLAATVYGDVTARGASLDLDVVVRAHDFSRAIETIRSLGYERFEPGLDAHDHDGDEWQAKAHLFPIAGGVPVDLHTELIGNTQTTPLELEAVLARATEGKVFGLPILMPAAEDLLLYLCLHGARHHWSRLLWLCDVAALVRINAIDWTALFARADTIDARERVALALSLLRTLLGADVPVERRALSPPTIPPSPARFALALQKLEQTTRGDERPRFGMRLVRELAARETMKQRLRFIAKSLEPNARDRAWLPLPRSLSWMRFALRPLRLILRFGRGVQRS